MKHLLPRLEFLLQALLFIRCRSECRRALTNESFSGVGDEWIGSSLIVIARRSER